MTTPTFPTGYTRPPDGGPQGMGAMRTWEQMLTMTTVNRLHPEVLRRFGALIHAGYDAGVPLGVGTGWRVQPNPPPAGFAQPGNSWHESCPVSPSSATALAIDTVPNVSWDWMHTYCGKYGLRHFKYVNNEPWHVQPAEISTSRKYATKLPPLVTWDLPGVDPPPPVVVPPTPPTGGVFTVNGYRMEVKQGSTGKMAKMCQQQINLIAGQGVAEDGNFGPQSVGALKNVQAVLRVPADGICGPKTWQAFEDGIKVQAEAGDWN
jgi:Putative peptidoglycan binding domain